LRHIEYFFSAIKTWPHSAHRSHIQPSTETWRRLRLVDSGLAPDSGAAKEPILFVIGNCKRFERTNHSMSSA
jgi:hypothetical protein